MYLYDSTKFDYKSSHSILRRGPDYLLHKTTKQKSDDVVIWMPCPCHMMTSSNGNISALLAICASFDLLLNKRLSKQGWHRWSRRHHGHYYVTVMPTPAIYYTNSSCAYDQPQSIYSSVWYVNVFLIYVYSLNTALRMLFIDSTRTSPLFAFKNIPLTMSSATKRRPLV